MLSKYMSLGEIIKEPLGNIIEILLVSNNSEFIFQHSPFLDFINKLLTHHSLCQKDFKHYMAVAETGNIPPFYFFPFLDWPRYLGYSGHYNFKK